MAVLVLHSRSVEIHPVVLVKSCWRSHWNIFVAEYIFKYIYRWHFLRVLYSLKGENVVVTLFNWHKYGKQNRILTHKRFYISVSVWLVSRGWQIALSLHSGAGRKVAARLPRRGWNDIEGHAESSSRPSGKHLPLYCVRLMKESEGCWLNITESCEGLCVR